MPKTKNPILIVSLILLGIILFLGIALTCILSIFTPFTDLTFRDQIGVIPIEGTISDSRSVISSLIKYKKDKRIKAIILRINSPGGSVAPTQEIYQEVRKTIVTKTVIASMSGVAASGGYYIAAATDKIVANPGTITGSIGVMIKFMRIEELLDRIGINFEIFKSGCFKDTGSPHRKVTEQDRELIQALVLDIKRQFVQDVSVGRNLPVEKVQKLSDGRIFTGAQAEEVGLVDSLGNFQDAVAIAKEMANIDGEVVLIYPKKSSGSLLDMFFKKAVNSFIESSHGVKGNLEYRWNGF